MKIDLSQLSGYEGRPVTDHSTIYLVFDNMSQLNYHMKDTVIKDPEVESYYSRNTAYVKNEVVYKCITKNKEDILIGTRAGVIYM